MNKLVLVLLSFLALNGCVLLAESEMVLTRVVADYCMAPESGRAIIQAQVRDALKPNTIQVVCAGDK